MLQHKEMLQQVLSPRAHSLELFQSYPMAHFLMRRDLTCCRNGFRACRTSGPRPSPSLRSLFPSSSSSAQTRAMGDGTSRERCLTAPRAYFLSSCPRSDVFVLPMCSIIPVASIPNPPPLLSLQMWGSQVNRSRDLARQALTYMDTDLALAVVRWTKAFNVALMSHLREDVAVREQLMGIGMKDAEVDAIVGAPHKPNLCIQVRSAERRDGVCGGGLSCACCRTVIRSTAVIYRLPHSPCLPCLALLPFPPHSPCLPRLSPFLPRRCSLASSPGTLLSALASATRWTAT